MKYKSNQNKYAYFTFVNRDKEIADKVITYLEENKCRLVYKENTNFSEDLTPDVLEQVKNASQLVVLISDTSVNSRLIKKEIDYALLRGIRVLCIYAKKFIEMIPTLEKKIASLESVLFLENDIDNFYDLLFKSMDPYVFDRAEQFEEYENQYTFFSKYKNYEFPSQTFLKPYVISQEFEDNLYDVSVARKKKINALFKEANFPAQVGTFFFYDSYTKFNLVFTQKITMSQAIEADNMLKASFGDYNVESHIPQRYIEINNQTKKRVPLSSLLKEAKAIKKDTIQFPIGLIENEILAFPLNEMTSIFVGASALTDRVMFMNQLINTYMYLIKSDEVKLCLIDLKENSFIKYAGLPHIGYDVIKDRKEANILLSRIELEVTKRETMFKEANVRNINAYNAMAFNQNLEPLPQIVLFVTECFNFFVKSSDDALLNIVEKGAKCGIFCVLGSEKMTPTTMNDVVKEHCKIKMAFATDTEEESILVTGSKGGESLTGNNEALIMMPGFEYAKRIKTAFLTDVELKKVIDFMLKTHEPGYYPFPELPKEDA